MHLCSRQYNRKRYPLPRKPSTDCFSILSRYTCADHFYDTDSRSENRRSGRGASSRYPVPKVPKKTMNMKQPVGMHPSLNPGHISGRYSPPYRPPDRMRCMTSSTVRTRLPLTVNTADSFGFLITFIRYSMPALRSLSLFAMFHIL